MENFEQKKMTRSRKIIGVIGILALMWLSFGGGLYLAGRNQLLGDIAKKEAFFIGKVLGTYSEPAEGQLAQDIDFGLFWDTWDTLKELYVDKGNIEDKKLFYGALKGMVAGVNDPYTVFMDPQISQEFQEDLSGTFEGIGAEIGIKDDVLTIIAPLPDMPAEKAGLLSGDKILMIDGKSTMGMSVDEAVSNIRGPKETEVTLTIMRTGEEAPREVKIMRGKIVIKSVKGEMREDGIYLIDISSFNDDTYSLFNEVIREIIEKNPKGIILDLRNNPGGYLDTAIEVSSEWVEDGPIVLERFKENEDGVPDQSEHLARGRARLKPFQTVILVNQGSASASEIVAGALQDYDLAKVIGMTTFGKGSVQTLTNLSDGSSLKVTVAKWLTPKGRSINEEGIEPTYKVDLKQEDYDANRDPQLEAAVGLILDGQVPEGLIATSTDVMATSTED